MIMHVYIWLYQSMGIANSVNNSEIKFAYKEIL